jgi:hypothetical protein
MDNRMSQRNSNYIAKHYAVIDCYVLLHLAAVIARNAAVY